MQALLGNRYRLGERIADGGMGSVYRAVDDNLGRPVAVKVLRRELVDEPAFLERFRREARAAAAVSHPGVAGVYDYGELDGRAFIVMELVEGETLAERIAARGRLPWREAFGIGEQVARALAAAHDHGLVHRDVKPANVLVGPGGRAKVTDFGIAICGRTPYTGANPVAIATQHVSAPVPDPSRYRPDLPAPATALIRRALAKHPADRFPSTKAMATALVTATLQSHPGHVGAPDRDPPGAPHPDPPDAGAPAREGSRQPRSVRGTVHGPQQPRPGTRRRGWPWRRSS